MHSNPMAGTIFGKSQEFGGAGAGVCVAAKVSTVVTGVSTVVARVSTVVAGAGVCVVAELRSVVARSSKDSSLLPGKCKHLSPVNGARKPPCLVSILESATDLTFNLADD